MIFAATQLPVPFISDPVGSKIVPIIVALVMGVSSPLSIVLWAIAIVGFIAPLVAGHIVRALRAKTAAVEGADPD